MVNGVSNVSLQHNPYGSIRKIGSNGNGRVLYNVFDSNGKAAGKLSVPNSEIDSFENAYNDIMDSAPKIKKYVSENSSVDDVRRRKAKSQAIVTLGGVTGACIPLFFTSNKSAIKKILAMGAGIFVGLASGFAAAFVSSLPPGTWKFERASNTLSKLDIKHEN